MPQTPFSARNRSFQGVHGPRGPRDGRNVIRTLITKI